MKLILVFLFLLTLESYSDTKSNFISKVKNCSIDIQKDSSIDIFIPNNLIILASLKTFKIMIKGFFECTGTFMTLVSCSLTFFIFCPEFVAM